MHKSTLLANLCTLGIVWVGDEAPLLVRSSSSRQGVEDRILVHQLLGATVVHVAHPTHLREAGLGTQMEGVHVELAVDLLLDTPQVLEDARDDDSAILLPALPHTLSSKAVEDSFGVECECQRVPAPGKQGQRLPPHTSLASLSPEPGWSSPPHII